LTLIELVMVVALLGLLAAIAIPGVQMAVEGRAVREAARSVNVFLGSARNRAMATGRPVGVVLQRFPNDANVCMTLQQVEAQPPYAGETLISCASLGYLRAYTNLPSGCSDPFPDHYPFIVFFHGGFDDTQIITGDQVQFDHQGLWYTVLDTPAPNATCYPALPGGNPPWRVVGIPKTQIVKSLVDNRLAWPWPDYLPKPSSGPDQSRRMSYRFLRQPVVPNSAGRYYVAIAKPMQLPLDAVMDLTWSGGPGSEKEDALNESEGHFSQRNAGSEPIVIMFTPSGGLGQVYVAGTPYPVTEPLYLLIARRDRIRDDYKTGDPDNLDDMSNLEEPGSFWITVNARTGLIGTAENGPVQFDFGTPPSRSRAGFYNQVPAQIDLSRRFAADPETMGGR
ncbi:MAG: hypothetical protein U1E05_25345, partial [Patescibacteria group bacterium]|nr:hypothetical protein [Patescibacteria group bacterium]